MRNRFGLVLLPLRVVLVAALLSSAALVQQDFSSSGMVYASDASVAISGRSGRTRVNRSLSTKSGGSVKLGDTVILATNSVDLNQNSEVISGDVTVNDASPGPYLADGVELLLGLSVDTPTGSELRADSIKIKSNAIVGGDVFFNDLDNNGTIVGGQNMPLDLPIFPTETEDIPACEAPAARPDAEGLTLNSGQSATIAAGDYGDILVKQNGVLTFSGGQYTLRSLNAGLSADLLFTAPAIVRIEGKFDTDQNSFVGPAPGSSIDASDILIVVGGINGNNGNLGATPKAAQIGLSSRAEANFCVPNGTLWIRQNAEAVGSFIGRDVLVGIGATVELDSFFRNRPPTADPQSLETTDAMVIITLTGSDPEGASLTFDVGPGPSAGILTDLTPIVPDPIPDDENPGANCNTNPELCIQPPTVSATVKYTPTSPGGEDSFTFTVEDDEGNTGTAVVTINPDDPSPPPPAVTAVDACPPLPSPLVPCTEDTAEGVAIGIGLDAEGPPGQELTFCIVSLPDGILTDSEGHDVESVLPPYALPTSSLVYTPTGGAGSTDSFLFEARTTGSCGDTCGGPTCDQATVTINITERQALAGEDQEITTDLNVPVQFNVIGNSGGIAKSGAPLSIAKAALALPAEIAGGVADTPPEDGSGDTTDVPLLVAAGVEVPGAGSSASVSATDSASDSTVVFHPVETFLFRAIVTPPSGTRDLRITPVAALTNAGGTVAVDVLFANPGSVECFNCSPFRSINAGSLTSSGNGGSGPATWSLSGVTFSDGGTATGTFAYDASTDTLSTWSISVAGGGASFPAFTWGDTLADHSANTSPLNELTRELLTLDASTDGTDVTIEVRFEPVFVQTGMQERTRVVFLLDKDQNAATGCDPGDGPPCGPASGGSASTDTLGWEFRIDAPTPSASSTSGLALIRRDHVVGGTTFVQNIGYSYVGNPNDTSGNNNFGISVTIPLSVLDGDEGSMGIKAFAAVLDNNQPSTSPSIGNPTDYIPNLGVAPAELQLALAGTVRTQIEFDISSLGTNETAIDAIDSATVTLTTEKGANDTVDTYWFVGDANGDGTLSPSDFEAAVTPLGGVVMPVPDGAAGSTGTFSFSVRNQVKAARLANPPIDFLTIQGRVDESGLTGFNQGLQVRTTGGASGEPILSITTPPPPPPLPLIEILSLPLLSQGTITTLAGASVSVGSTFPGTTTLVFTPATGFFGPAQLTYQVTEGIVIDTAIVDFLVVFNDTCTINGREPGCAPSGGGQ